MRGTRRGLRIIGITAGVVLASSGVAVAAGGHGWGPGVMGGSFGGWGTHMMGGGMMGGSFGGWSTGRGMMGGSFNTGSTCQAPTVQGSHVTLTAVDMGGMMGGSMYRFMPMGSTVRAGRVTIDLVNAGSMPHELLVFPLASGQQPGTRAIGADDRIDETASLGEVKPVCAQDPSVDGIATGNTARVTLQLQPGTYELICNLPGHYRRGMWAVLRVV